MKKVNNKLYKNVFFYIIITIIIICFIVNIIKINKRHKIYLYNLLFTDSGKKFIEAYKLDSNKYVKYIPIPLYIFLTRLIIIIGLIFYFPIILINQLFYKYDMSYFQRVNYLLEYPLKHNELLNSLESAIETSIIDKDKILEIQHKLFWNELFIKNNVNTPQIVGLIDNGKLYLDKEKYNSNKEYIIKYEFGGDSGGLNKFDINNIPLKEKYIIQERIRNKEYNGYIRIVTIRNKKNEIIPIFSYFYILNKKDFEDNNKISSARIEGGSVFEIDINNKKINPVFDDIILNDYFQNIINNFNWDLYEKAINDCIKLHSKINYCNSVAWDVIITDNTHYLLEGNIPGGTLHNLNKKYYEKTMKYNENIKYFI